MKFQNHMTLEFPSRSSNESFARSAVACFAAQLDPTLEELGDIKTAVSEAVTNCIIHAYNTSEGIIKIESRLTENSIEIEVSDRGKGIENIELAMKEGYSTASSQIRELGFGAGMGLPNMKKYSDDMDIKSVVGEGTTITMKFNLNN